MFLTGVCVCACAYSVVSSSATVALPAPLSMGFSRQEYWSGLPFPSPGDLPNPGIEPTSPVSPVLQADSLPTEPPGKPGDARKVCGERGASLMTPWWSLSTPHRDEGVAVLVLGSVQGPGAHRLQALLSGKPVDGLSGVISTKSDGQWRAGSPPFWTLAALPCGRHTGLMGSPILGAPV